MYEPGDDHDGVHVSVSQARDGFADLVNRAAYKEERVIITRRGRAIAAIVPIEDVAYLERLEDEYDVQEALKVLNDPTEMANTIPWEQVEAELDGAQEKG
jgi:prevent-host-death family protein